ncbi:glutaredoxin-C6-like [Solanum dulcamara]|uniref:glutaredoxin-C6-like n=1 Tax=Solanum dulcamara TaxID=45834 RepID=UPI002485F654|nr:glutaredoxin-C6-like [Solanum dulcamara]
MQDVRRYSPLSDGGGVTLELTTTTISPLAIDVTESTEMRIRRLISENPVVIFTRSACCMCHVMKRLLLSAVSVHPTVIQLEEEEIAALPGVSVDSAAAEEGGETPALYIGGTRVGGLESLVALHLSGRLVPKLVEVGAITEMVL